MLDDQTFQQLATFAYMTYFTLENNNSILKGSGKEGRNSTRVFMPRITSVKSHISMEITFLKISISISGRLTDLYLAVPETVM